LQALHILEKFADVQSQSKDLKEGRPHEPEPETLAELEESLDTFQSLWKAEVDRVSKRAGLESMSAAEQAELDMALRTCDHKLRLAVTAASRKVRRLLVVSLVVSYRDRYRGMPCSLRKKQQRNVRDGSGCTNWRSAWVS
jgi:hypothetical protein